MHAHWRARIRPSGLNDKLIKADSFLQYCEQAKAMVEKSRRDLGGPNRETIIQANTPWEHAPVDAKIGVICLHGLYESPACMNDLANIFCDQNMHVMNVLLPGHGSVPGDLLNIEYPTWQAMLDFAIAELRPQVDILCVLGFSTGATLGLSAALAQAPIDKLIMLAPAIQIKNRLSALAGALRYFGAMVERGHWFLLADETDYAKYQSITFNSIYQVECLTQKIASQTHDCPCDSFMILSDDDEVISTQKAYTYFIDRMSKKSELLLYSNQKTASDSERVTIKPSRNLNAGILSYAHQCLAISPDNKHYGVHGDFKDFLHYKTGIGTLLPHQHDKDYVYGAFTLKEALKQKLCRIRFNPDFKYMQERIVNFIRK